jgi:hypothetical protein
MSERDIGVTGWSAADSSIMVFWFHRKTFVWTIFPSNVAATDR